LMTDFDSLFKKNEKNKISKISRRNW